MDSLKDYLVKRNIIISPNKKERILQQEQNEYNILRQIEIICDFHERVKNGDGIFLLRLESNIGKEMEECKVHLKRLKKMLLTLENEGAKDVFEEELLSSGYSVVKRAELCIKSIEEEEYIRLIKRSMKDNELCLLSCENNNLWMDESIHISDPTKLCFNMVEWDLITYLNKIKRKGINIDYHRSIGYFIEKSKLDKTSEIYIKAMISYPYDYMKVCQRKREGKRKWTPEEYCEKLNLAMRRDGSMII